MTKRVGGIMSDPTQSHSTLAASSLLDHEALDGAAEIAARYSPGEPGGTSPSFEKSAFYGRLS
jgi:hypothetical protein